MATVSDEILEHLKPLVGLRLSVARRAADLRNFQFGTIRPDGRGSVGDYALHVQCSWRIDGPNGIVTGRADLWEPTTKGPNFNWDQWDYEKDGNLQDLLIGEWLGGRDPYTGSHANLGDGLIVEAVEADDFGGATISLTGGYRIVLFPAGSRGEDWRIFRPSTEHPHFVVSAGCIEHD